MYKSLLGDVLALKRAVVVNSTWGDSHNTTVHTCRPTLYSLPFINTSQQIIY